MDNDKYIGQLLDDRYEILDVLGIGGMAVVYKARCRRLNRLVAIKILKDEFSQDEEFRRRFHAESQAVAMLSHPNIVSVYDVSSSDEADFIVMELIDGITLKQYMEKKGVLNWKETLHFAIQIAKALEHAHGRGIVHRDIKPHNVMVLKNGSVKVADFGIAQVNTNSSTMTTEALGSVHYISPEQAKGGRVDDRSDLYSLGIVMYEMITGRVPYDGDSPVSIAIQHINGGAAKPTEVNPGVPKGLEQIIMKALALAPRDRYHTATEMLYDMDEFRKDPTVIFDHTPAPIDGATRVLPSNLEKEAAQAPKSIAERTVEEKTAPKPRRETRQQEVQPVDEEDEGHNRVAAIAIASCVVVGIVAIVVFLIILGQSGAFGNKQNMVDVPNLLGQNFDTLREYPGIEVVRLRGEYNDEYEKGQIISQSPNHGDQVVEGTKVFVIVSLGEKPPVQTMEDLVRLNAEEANKFLNGLDMDLHVMNREEHSADIPVGYVTRTEPAEGDVLTEGQTIYLWISTGPEIIIEEMPDVMGKPFEEAVSILNENGFHNVRQNPVDSDEPKGEVVGQSVPQYEKIDVTTVIVLDVSTGVPAITPPDPGGDDPDNPTDSTEPTEPEDPTDPEDGEIKLDYVFVVPSRTESYLLSIKCGDQWILENMTITPGQTTVSVTLTGNGTQTYLLYIDGVFEREETVVFDPDD